MAIITMATSLRTAMTITTIMGIMIMLVMNLVLKLVPTIVTAMRRVSIITNCSRWSCVTMAITIARVRR